jgi:hypothetical protein
VNDREYRAACRTVGAFLNRNTRTVPSPDEAYSAGRRLLKHHGVEPPAHLKAHEMRLLLEEAGVIL